MANKYLCDKCGKEFENRKKAEEHEKSCKKQNSNKKIFAQKKCSSCGKEVGHFSGWDFDGKKFCSLKCKKDYKEGKTAIIKEYKRKCKECGKVWHVLASREEKLQKDMKGNQCDQMTSACGMCGGNWMALQSSTQAKRNEHALTDEITRLKHCPNCGSGNYEEKEIVYKKK